MLNEIQINSGIQQWNGNEISPEHVVDIIDFIKTIYLDSNDEVYCSIYESLLEGMLNIKHHAYSYDEITPWRVGVEWDVENVKITITDFGQTIPLNFLNKLKRQDVKFLNDSILIHEAVNSSFQEGGRGTGLKSIINLVDKKLFDSVKIRSRNGLFLYNLGGCKVTEQNDILLGTELEFSLTLKLGVE